MNNQLDGYLGSLFSFSFRRMPLSILKENLMGPSERGQSHNFVYRMRKNTALRNNISGILSLEKKKYLSQKKKKLFQLYPTLYFIFKIKHTWSY